MKKLLTLFVCLMIVLGAWGALTSCSEDALDGALGGNDEPSADSITNLTYNGEVITWTSVKNAKNYKININIVWLIYYYQ